MGRHQGAKETRSHPNQARASARKRRCQQEKRQALETAARSAGITVSELQGRQHQEVQQIILDSRAGKIRVLSAWEREQEARQCQQSRR